MKIQTGDLNASIDRYSTERGGSKNVTLQREAQNRVKMILKNKYRSRAEGDAQVGVDATAVVAATSVTVLLLFSFLLCTGELVVLVVRRDAPNVGPNLQCS